MAQIDVTETAPGRFRVEVAEGASRTTHEVSASADELERYGGADDAPRLLKLSFEFLLEREPKESILRSFRLGAIESYFPEYPREIARRLR